jgi:hypothetical protein
MTIPLVLVTVGASPVRAMAPATGALKSAFVTDGATPLTAIDPALGWITT